MSLFTSEKFASASAAGTDWRDAARAVLEQLESIRTENDGFSIGFLYITDQLTDDVASILTLFRSVTKIEHWIGATGIGVCTCDENYTDRPAIVAMIGRLPQEEFCLFQNTDTAPIENNTSLKLWLNTHEALLVLTHGTSNDTQPTALRLNQLGDLAGGFIVGGMASSRAENIHFAHDINKNGLSGAAFSTALPVATTISQGCAPIGPFHTLTEKEGPYIKALDNRPIFEILGKDIQDFIDEKAIQPPESTLHGEVHAALPVPGTDNRDYIVRRITGLDPDKGLISLEQTIHNGEQVMFVHRDKTTLQGDLSHKLTVLRRRIQSENGGIFAPKGGLYISCIARQIDNDKDMHNNELALIREIIGEIPLAGFYAHSEISNQHLYDHTGILILFL